MGTETFRWRTSYTSIQDGQAVRASITNRPLDDLFQNQVYLKSVLDAMTAGKSLLLPDQTLGSAVTVGMSVYMTAAGVWQPALAELSNTTTSTLFTLTEKAYVAGIVTDRNTFGRGTVAIFGQVTMDATHLLAIIEGTYQEGIYYLSPYTPGFITASKGVAPIKVCLIYGPDADNNYRVIITPDQRAQIESHGHYHVPLVASPAGDANCVPGKAGFMWGDLEPDGPYPGIVHTVVNADATLPGWLPISDPSFVGQTIPVGAKFGYNIPADPDVADIWPPMPVDNVYIEVDGNGEVGDLIVVNTDGIWWMDDTYGHAPWPVNTPCVTSSTGSSSTTPYPIWPIRIDMWFTKVIHGTTLDALNNHIELNTPIVPAIEPIAVGDDIVPYFIPTLNVQGYKLAYAASSSSSSSSTSGVIASNKILYRVDMKDFLVVGLRQPTLAVELLLAGNLGSTSTVTEIQSGIILRLITLPAPITGGSKDFTDATIVTPVWTEVPTTPTLVPAEKYFRFVSETIDLGANDAMYIEIEWNGYALAAITDEVYILSVRPRLSL